MKVCKFGERNITKKITTRELHPFDRSIDRSIETDRDKEEQTARIYSTLQANITTSPNHKLANPLPRKKDRHFPPPKNTLKKQKKHLPPYRHNIVSRRRRRRSRHSSRCLRHPSRQVGHRSPAPTAHASLHRRHVPCAYHPCRSAARGAAPPGAGAAGRSRFVRLGGGLLDFPYRGCSFFIGTFALGG